MMGFVALGDLIINVSEIVYIEQDFVGSSATESWTIHFKNKTSVNISIEKCEELVRGLNRAVSSGVIG